MRLVQDALERQLDVPERPARIVSLVPSLTELLFDLGAGERLVGCSRYCTHPVGGALDGIARVGGQKDPDRAAIAALEPDLVLAVREENLKRDVEKLAAAGIAVYVADVTTLDDALALIGEIGDLVDGEPRRIAEVRAAARAGVEAARVRAPRPAVRVFAPVWRDPWIAISSRTYMYEVVEACGGAPVLGGTPARRYPKVSHEAVRAARPEAILLPDEPYPFSAADVRELSSIAPTAVVDGKTLQWYGRRTGEIAQIAETIARLAGR